ncbi:MAG: PepSY domain-containing protein [Caulobacter sp.]|nr:PepSY domain-containing protein [Caulobacter sp.]
MRPATVRIWSLVHKWTSLICTVFLLMLCVTGLPLIFHHEIDDLTGHDRWRPANPGGPMLTYDQVLETALKRRPGEVPIFMSFDDDRPVVNVTSGPTADAPGSRMTFAPIDRTSGDPVPPTPAGGVMDFILQLHTDLFLGLAGMLFLGAMGLLFAASVISGIVVYAPFMRRLPFGTVRASRSARVKWLDYHNVLGAVTLAWVLVVGVTGVVNTLAGPITDSWKAGALASLSAPYQGKPPPARMASLDAAVRTAQAAMPGMEVQFVAFPGSGYSTGHHYAVFLHGTTPLTRHLARPALIDAETGDLTAVQDMPLLSKVLSLSQPLHFGDYGGLPLKILWAVLDLITLVVLGSGVYLWLGAGRRKPVAVTPDEARA